VAQTKRNDIAELAGQLGLGPVRRLHRQRLRYHVKVVLVPLGLATAALAVLAYLGGYGMATVLLPVAFWGTTAALTRFMPVSERDGRRWIAVCDRGLLLGADRWTEVIDIPWHAIRACTEVDSAIGRFRRVDWVADGGIRSVFVGAVTGERDLWRAVAARGPVRSPVARRVALVTAAVVVEGVAVWQVGLPSVMVVTIDERPDELTDFARGCELAGARFSQVAPYSGQDPLPLVLFEVSWRRVHSDGNAPAFVAESSPSEVRLIGCSHRTDEDEVVETCSYSGGVTIKYYRSVFRVDVYEARTHHKVGGFTVLGSSDVTCPFSTYAREGDEKEEQMAPPHADDYAEALSRFERITNSADANRLLTRSYRAPWRLAGLEI
jgi:hypothetical protein